jgi:hypothetical protein
MAFYVCCHRVDLLPSEIEEMLCVRHDVWFSDVAVGVSKL